MKQLWLRASKGHAKSLDDFWQLTEREFLTYVLAHLEEKWAKDSERALEIQHQYAAFGQDPPDWGELMGIPKHSEYHPEYISREEAEQFADVG